METKKTAKSYSPEVKERAVRMVLEHRGAHASQWTAICSIAVKIGCSGETLRHWLRRHERDAGLQDGMTSEVWDRLKALERENRELRQANEIPGFRRGRLCARLPPILGDYALDVANATFCRLTRLKLAFQPYIW